VRLLLAQEGLSNAEVWSKEVITGKVVANAGSHRILAALGDGPCDSRKLKDIVGAINSVARFDGEYMARLEHSSYVRRKGDLWYLTEAGHEKLESLGPVRRPGKTSVAASRTTVGVGILDPKMYQQSWTRPGSEDFLKFPSRMGNKLYYRDGRVETILETIGEADGY